MRNHALVAALLIVCTTPAAHAATYAEAVAAFRADDYEVAAAGFEALIEERPEWVPGRVALGQCYHLLGQHERGEEQIREAHQLDPSTDLFKPYDEVGNRLYGKRRFDQAILPLEKALENAPDERRQATSLRLAHAYLMTDRLEAARRAFERHADQFGASFETSYKLALTCQRAGDYPCALANLRTASGLEAPPEKHDRARTYLGQWSHYWTLDPNNRTRRKELASRAVDDTRAWFEADPRSLQAQRSHAEVLLAAGRADAVVTELGDIAGGDGQACVAQEMMARAHNALDDGPTAAEWARRAIACDPSAAQPHIELAAALVRQLRPNHEEQDAIRADQKIAAAAVASLKTALDLEPSASQRTRTMLSDTEQTLERLREAEADAAADRVQSDELLRQQIAQRCKTLLWDIRRDSRSLSTEETTFFGEHDCEGYAPPTGN